MCIKILVFVCICVIQRRVHENILIRMKSIMLTILIMVSRLSDHSPSTPARTGQPGLLLRKAIPTKEVRVVVVSFKGVRIADSGTSGPRHDYVPRLPFHG